MVAFPIRELLLRCKKPKVNYPKKSDTSLGAALKTERLNRGLIQEETAELLNLAYTEYQRFETNKHVPGINKGKRKAVNEFIGYNYWCDGTGSIQNEILKYRIQHGLTSPQLAEEIGVSKNTINRAMNGEKVSEKMKKIIESYIV